MFRVSVPGEGTEAPDVTPPTQNPPQDDTPADTETAEYVLNTSSKKVHTADCSHVKSMSDKNKEIRFMTLAELWELLTKGYAACKTCLSEYAD